MSPVTYWMATLIWDTVVSLVFLTIAAIIIQAFQVIAIAIALLIISIIMSIYVIFIFGFVKLQSYI